MMNFTSFASSSIRQSGQQLTDVATSASYSVTYSPESNAEAISARFSANPKPVLASVLRDPRDNRHYFVTDLNTMACGSVAYHTATLAPVRGFATLSRSHEVINNAVPIHLSPPSIRLDNGRDQLRQSTMIQALIPASVHAKQGDSLELNGITYQILGTTLADTEGLSEIQIAVVH